MKSRQKNQHGFTLLEVVITLFIIAVILALYQVSLTGMLLTRNSRDQETALRIANNKIEELRAAGYSSLPASSSFSDPLLNNLGGSSASVATSDYNDKTKQVVVSVSWNEPGTIAGRTFSLTTLITKIGGLK